MWMVGELENLICLATYANEFLNGPKGAKPKELCPKNSAFDFVYFIRFLDMKGRTARSRSVTISKGTAGWFKYLRRKGVEHLRIAIVNWNDSRPYLPDRVSVAFASCGNWVLVSEGPEGSKVWVPEWESYEPKSKRDHQIWAIDMKGFKSGIVPLKNKGPTISQAKDALEEALKHISSYDKRRRWGWSKGWFSKALAILRSDRPNLSILKDIVPKGWGSKEARRLLVAADRSWVFGGMCSWNDVNMGKGRSKRDYVRVSNALYKAMTDAIVTAANEVQ